MAKTTAPLSPPRQGGKVPAEEAEPSKLDLETCNEGALQTKQFPEKVSLDPQVVNPNRRRRGESGSVDGATALRIPFGKRGYDGTAH